MKVAIAIGPVDGALCLKPLVALEPGPQVLSSMILNLQITSCQQEREVIHHSIYVSHYIDDTHGGMFSNRKGDGATKAVKDKNNNATTQVREDSNVMHRAVFNTIHDSSALADMERRNMDLHDRLLRLKIS